jgi:hypothetical protein
VSISIGVGLFLLALALSAVIVPQLLYLHLLQALIYLVLTQRNNAWGYGIGVIVPTAWNCLNLFVTHLFQKGAVQFWSLVHSGQFWFLLRTGQVSRPETMTVMIGGAAHVLIIVACVAGFFHLRPRRMQWGQFFGGGVLALAYLAVIIAIAAPR